MDHATSFDGVAVLEFTLNEPGETLTDTPWILHRSDGKSDSLHVVLFANAERPPGSAAVKVFRWAVRGERATAAE